MTFGGDFGLSVTDSGPVLLGPLQLGTPSRSTRSCSQLCLKGRKSTPTTSRSLVARQAVVTRVLLAKCVIPVLFPAGTSGSGSFVVVVLRLPVAPQRRRQVGISAFKTPNQGLESSFCCCFAGQRISEKECFFHRHRYDHLSVAPDHAHSFAALLRWQMFACAWRNSSCRGKRDAREFRDLVFVDVGFEHNGLLTLNN